MVKISIEYQGGLRCEAIHGPSSGKLLTDAPVDNHGRGESFSPTDLLATALGTCMATVMGILARERNYPLAGAKIRVLKQMTPPPRRVARLDVTLDIPAQSAAAIDATGRAELERRANECPVRLSLLPAFGVPVAFNWGSSQSPP